MVYGKRAPLPVSVQPGWVKYTLLDEGTFPNIWTRRKMLSDAPVFFEQMEVESLMEAKRYTDASNILGRWLQENSTPLVWLQYAKSLKCLNDESWKNGFVEAVKALNFPLSYPNMVPNEKGWITSIIREVPIAASTIVEICSIVEWKILTINSDFVQTDLQTQKSCFVHMAIWFRSQIKGCRND